MLAGPDADGASKYFDTIPRKRLLAEIQKRIADGKVLKLLESYLEAGVWETGKGWQPTEQGTPQGSVISPLLSNIYLNPLDHKMAQDGYEMVRYADDAVVCCRTETRSDKESSRRKTVERLKTCVHTKLLYFAHRSKRRGSQVVRQGSAKALCVGSIPTSASNSKLQFCNGLQMPEEASASESASEIITGLRLNNYPGITRQSLAMTGFAARLV